MKKIMKSALLKLVLLSAIVSDACATYELKMFCKAIERGDISEIERMILINKHIVNQRTPSGSLSPLMGAAFDTSQGNGPEILDLLIEHGAEVNAKDNFGQTALHFVRGQNAAQMVGILIKHGAEVDANDNSKRTPLMNCAGSWNDKRKEAIPALLRHGANMQAQDNRGWTPLHHAVFANNKNTQILLEAGADPHAEDNSGRTPLFWLRPTRDDQEKEEALASIVQLLLDYKASLNARSLNGETPLHWMATQSGREYAVKVLLEHGADVDALSFVMKESEL